MSIKLDSQFALRFITPLALAGGSLVILLGILAASQNVAYAGSALPLPVTEGCQAAPGMLPPPGPAGAPGASPPADPLFQGGSGHSVITVCASCPYTTVQSAVIAVAGGGTVKVAQGVYTDTDDNDRVVEITKTLTLQGGYTTTNWTTPNAVAYPTILDGEGGARVVYIEDGVAPTIEGFHIRSGFATNGGGIYIAGGEPALRRNRIYSNTAGESGGGIYVAGGEPTLENNLIYTNTATAKLGGGVYIAGGASLLHHNTLYGNQADDGGGGIYIASGTSVVSATIVVSNVVSSGGGGIHSVGGTSVLGYNDVWGNSPVNYSGVTSGTGSISAFPSFADLAEADFRLQVDSPCIDQVPLTQTVAVDYNGWARHLGERSDIGAYEFYTGTCFARIEGATRVYTTIQAAVNAASGDDLVKVAGFCTGSGTDPVVNLNKALILRGGYTLTNWSDPDADTCPTILDGQDSRRVVYIGSVAATVEGFHIRNGRAASGGGIYIAGSSPLVRNNDIHSNTASIHGGGVYINGGSPEIRDDNAIYSNTASSYGGGIYINNGTSDLQVQGNSIYGNTAGGRGGGIYIAGGSASVEDNEIYNNRANGGGSDDGGGGLFVRGGGPIIRGNAIYSNSINGSSSGGGINVWNTTAVVIERNDIHHNSGGYRGGGIYVRDHSHIIRNNLVYNNTASQYGGGITYWWGSGVMENNTIYGNSAGTSGGGIYKASGTTAIRNNIIVSNTSGGGIAGATCYYCDIWGNTGGNTGGGTGSISANPHFVSPGVNFHLQSGSPCIDTAHPSSHPNDDYDGYNRPFGPRADMGAYEFYAGTCFAQINGATRIYSTTQAAVDAAGGGGLVKVAGVCQPALARTVGGDTFTQTVYISKSLTLRGGYAITSWSNPITSAILDAQGLGRVVYITGTGAVTVDGFIVRGGTAITGGGLYVAMSLSPTLQNLVVYSNTASYGGGFASAGGNPRLYNDTFVTNSATITGGGLYFDAGYPAISNTLVVSNVGGGLYATSDATPTLAYNDVWQNAGGNYAGNVTTGTTDFSVDPLFADFAGRDFHLQAGSLCVHTGDPGTTLDRDFEGDERPLGRGYDVGADESATYPDVAFAPQDLSAGGIPGQPTVHTHYLTNTGSISATFDLTHTMTISGPGTGWDVDYTSVFALAAGEVVEVPVTVHVPDGAISGTSATAVLTATSSVNDTIYDVVSNTTVANWNPGVLLAPAYAEYINPGAVITYVHTLTNTGNASDTFQITWNSSRGWSGVTPTQNLALGPLMTTTVWISLTVPPTAPGGLVETTILTATGDSGAWTVVTDTFQVNHTPGARYVTTSGNDTLNNCLIASLPCRTIVYAVGQATSDDVVEVAAGTYNEYDVSLNKNITLRGGYSADFSAWNPDAYLTALNAQGLGRVLYIFGSPTVEGFTLQGGSTPGSGGGVYVNLGSPILRRNVITGNVAAVYGGGVYNESGSPTLERNVLAFNTADRGGGFASGNGSPGFWNNLVYENSASADGGGVYVVGGSPAVWHDTIYSNTANRGGGFYLASGSPVVSNTIVVSNTALIAGGGVYSQAAGAALDYNDVWNNTNGDYVGLSAGSHSTATNPLFVDAMVGDLHLQEGSPCVDIGDATALEEDVDGHPRTMGDVPDVGADEFLRPGMELEPDRADSGLPGQAVLYIHTLTNTGTYTDTFAFTAQSSQGWSVTPPDPVELGSGLATTVQVQVGIPAGILSGTVDTTVVTATSGFDVAIFDTAVDTTTVGLTRDVLLEPDRSGFIASAPPGSVDVVYTHTLSNLGNYTDTFDLISASDQGLTVTVAPAAATLGGGADTTIYVTVTVPSIPTDTVLVDTTFITAVSQSVITVTDPASDTTYVNLDLGVELAPDREGSDVPGETLYYIHTLTNAGNYSDTFAFAAQSSQGWDVHLPAPVELGSGLTTTVQVQVPIPAGTLSNTVDTTVVTVTSQFSTAVSASVVDTTTVEQDPGVSLEPEWPDAAGWCVLSPPTVTVSYLFSLSNLGNFTDTFDIAGTSSQGWLVTLNPISATLAPGASTDVWVSVQVPSTTARILDTVIVTATSRADNTVSDSASYTTRVNWDVDVELEPNRSGTVRLEDSIVYTHILTNTGEDANTIDLTWQSSQGWNVVVNGSTSQPVVVALDPDMTATVQVRVMTPLDVISAVDTTRITATTRYYCHAWDVAVDTTTVARPHVTLYPDHPDGSAGPGTVITYTHVLSNSGVVSDTYTITYTSSLGWATSITPTVVYTLPPESAVPVTVTVGVPTGTLAYEADTTVITATSQFTDTIYDTATDITTVPYAPGALLKPDHSGQAAPNETVTYTHILTNSGNYTETFDLATHSEFGYSKVNPSRVEGLGPGAYRPITVTVQLPNHAAAGEVEHTAVIASFAGGQAVANDHTTVSSAVGTRYVAPDGRDDNNNCIKWDGLGPCATIQHAVDQAVVGDEVRIAQGIYTDIHAIGVVTQVVHLTKSLTLRGGYATDDWGNSDPVARETVLDAGGHGRVVYVAGSITPTIEGFHLWRGNVSGDGAGLYIAAGAAPAVRSNRIYSNTASGAGSKGGGVYYAGGDNPILERNTIYSNTAEDGGGLYVASGSPAVWNNVVYHNTAGDLGGGLYSGGSSTVWNNTFYSNTASSGGGIYLAGGSPVVSNTIVAENAQYGIYRAGGSPVSAYNLVWANGPAGFYDVAPGSGTITATPHFVDAACNDLRLRGVSPAINAGDPNGTQPGDDRDGSPRPLPSGSHHDIGAYEYGLIKTKRFVAEAPPGAVITYTIVVTNDGATVRTNVPVTDTLHSYLDYAGLLTYTAGSGNIVGGRTISWTGPVAAYSAVYITFTAQITDWPAVGTAITNVAWVDHACTDVVTTTVGEKPGPRYVEPAGQDVDGADGVSNNCLVPTKPCRTVQYAVDQALGGDEVRVATGVYTDELDAGQVVSVTEAITLTGGYTTTGWVYSPDDYATTLNAQGGAGVVITAPATTTVALAGLRIVGGGDGVAVYMATVVISRTRVYSNSGDGVRVVGGGLTLERTRVYSNSGDGVDLSSSSYQLDNNVVVQNGGIGLRATGTSSGALRHNTLARNISGGVVVSGAACLTNTILVSHTVGITVTAGSTATLDATLWGAGDWANTTDWEGAGTLISSTNYYSAPVFTDPDYHIGSSSGAINTGVETGLTEDIDGGERPLLAAPDIGADEFPLVVGKYAPENADPGQVITYVITLEGEGSGLVLTDTLDILLAYTGTVACSAGDCGYLAAQQAITWTGSLSTGYPVYITYTTQITTWLAAGVQIINDAQVRLGSDVLDSAPAETTINPVPGARHTALTGQDVDGVNNNCLVPTKPCRTVQYAVDQALGGDVVRVAEGVYNDTLGVGQVASVAKSITLTGGYTTTGWVYNPDDYATMLDAQGGAGVVITGPVTVTLAGFRIVGGSDGVSVYAATASISRTRVYSNSGDGVRVVGGDLTLERVLVYSNAGDGVDVNAGSFALVNSVIAHNEGAGLRTAGSAGALLHNTFARNAAAGAVISSTAGFTNTIFYSHTVGVSVTTNSTAYLSHTLWYSNAANLSAGTLVSSTNLWGEDPAFVDPAALDYHVRGDSAVLNAGVWASVGEDVDGDTRPVGQAPDVGADQYPLRLDRWVSTASALPCQVVTHALRLTNMRTAPLAGVRLTDTLDVNTSWAGFADATTGSTEYVTASHAIAWAGDVPANGTAHITYTARITPYLTSSTLLTHTAAVSDPISIFSTPPLTVSVTTLTATLSKEAETAVSIGQVVTYTVSFTVPAGHVAHEPVVVDTLPRLVTGGGISTTPALTYVVGSAGTPPVTISSDGGVITWTLGTVTATCGASEVVTVAFAAQVRHLPDNDAGDLLTNTVALSYTETTVAGAAHALTAAHTATLVEPGVVVTKGMSPDSGLGSLDTVIVTVVLTNTGMSTLYDVVVTDTLPAGLIFQGGTAGYSRDGQVVVWTATSVGALQQRVFTITAQVEGDVGANQALLNEVGVRGTSRPGAVDEERVYTDTAQATATTGYPDLVIGKERGPAVRAPGQVVTYTIVYANDGVVRAENVRITDTLPALLTDVISATSAPATVEHVGQTVTWMLGTLGRGEGGALWITGSIALDAPDGALLTNVAGITSDTAEQDTADNSDSATTTVRRPVLSISKVAYPSAVFPGGLLTYTLTVFNTGQGEALNLLISDTVPADTEYQACSGGDSCDYNSGSGVVTWVLASLPAGGQAQFTFTVRVGQDVEYNTYVVNQAYSVSSAQGVSGTGSPVSTLVGLVGSVSLEPDRAGSGAPGDQVVYQHTLVNLANAGQTIDLSASSSEGWQVSVAPDSVHLAAGAQAAVVVTVTVGSDATEGTVDTTVVTAVGQTTGSDTATDMTTALDYQRYVYLPLVLRNYR